MVFKQLTGTDGCVCTTHLITSFCTKLSNTVIPKETKVLNIVGDMEQAVKLVMIGDSNVGKSQLSLRYCKKKFVPDSQSTVGIEFATRAVVFNEHTVKAQIWDTAGTRI
jgi:GTPase SAR1 family protein